jgi:hypothetical protein
MTPPKVPHEREMQKNRSKAQKCISHPTRRTIQLSRGYIRKNTFVEEDEYNEVSGVM